MLSSCGPPSRLAPAAYPLSLRRRNAVRMRSASEGFCHRPSLVNSITNFPAWQEGSGRCSEIFYLFAAGNLGKSPEAPRSRSGLSTNRLLPAQAGASGKRVLPVPGRHTFAQACGAITFRTITHGCRAAVPFGLSPKRHQKRFFPSIRRPRRMNHPLPTGCDRLRLRR